jgi:CheY-like chemotaxis protein
MSDLQLGRVRAALYDPQYMNRQVTLGALQTLGVVQVEPLARVGDLEAALNSAPYDLFIAELQGGEDVVCDLVNRVRHRKTGPNPFIVVLLTTWDLNADAVRAVLNSGADDLLARPYTIAQLQQRLTGAALARKPFVVTADYVGPSRRNGSRDPEEGELFEVPNLMRKRINQTDDRERDKAEIDEAWGNVLRWKAIRLGRQLEAWSVQLTKNAVPARDEEAINALTSRIAQTAIELRSYVSKASNPAYGSVAEFCNEIGKVSEGFPTDRQLEKFLEFAALIADQVRIATTSERNGTTAGVVPFYIG